VGRILEEHGGVIELRDAADKFPNQRGAWVRLRFAAAPVTAAPAPPRPPNIRAEAGDLSTTISEH